MTFFTPLGHEAYRPAAIFGLDFSGGVEAGKKIWLAGGDFRNGRLTIATCIRAQTLPGSGVERSRCLPALCRFIAQQGESAFGCDFPFSLPAQLMDAADWEGFVGSFATKVPDAAAFRAACVAATDGRELRRPCDAESRTPFCAYNLRLFRQTHAGIAEVLAPLVQERAVSVLPMQVATRGRPVLLEVCPASTLKRLGWYLRGYKGRSEQAFASRLHILTALEDADWFSLAPELRAGVLADPEGDALDSVIAAYATADAFREPARHDRANTPAYALEGYVYA